MRKFKFTAIISAITIILTIMALEGGVLRLLPAAAALGLGCGVLFVSLVMLDLFDFPQESSLERLAQSIRARLTPQERVKAKVQLEVVVHVNFTPAQLNKAS